MSCVVLTVTLLPTAVQAAKPVGNLAQVVPMALIAADNRPQTPGVAHAPPPLSCPNTRHVLRHTSYRRTHLPTLVVQRRRNPSPVAGEAETPSPEASFLALGSGGKTLAAAYAASKAALWDLQTGRLLRVFPVKVMPNGVGFTTDGQTLVTAEADSNRVAAKTNTGELPRLPPLILQEWNLATGKLLKAWTARGGELGAYSPDFRQKASEGNPKENEKLYIHIFDTRSDKLLSVVASSYPWLFASTQFSTDSRYLVGLTDSPKGDPIVGLWDLRTRASLLFNPVGETPDFYFSPDSSLLATAFAGTEHGIRLWSMKYGHREAGLPSKLVDTLAFSPDNHVLAAIGEDRRFVIYETATGNPIKSFIGENESIRSLLFTSDGSKLVAAYADGAIRIYNWRKGRLLLTLQTLPCKGMK